MDSQFAKCFEKAIVKINSVLIKALHYVLCVLFAALIFIVTVNVVFRYLLKMPLFWVTELACYILVYLIFFGAALALYRGEHVSVNVEGIKMPRAWKRFFEISGIFFNYLFIVLLIVFGTMVAFKNMGSRTGSLPIPTGCVYLAAPSSGIVMLMLYTEHMMLKKKDG